MCPVSYIIGADRNLLFHMQRNPPVPGQRRMTILSVNSGKIFTACQTGRLPCTWIGKNPFRLSISNYLSLGHNQQFFTKAKNLIPAVRHQNNCSPIFFQQFHHFPLQAIFQKYIQCGKRFVQKEHLRFICHDPRQSRPLLLSPGKLLRKLLFQTFQPEFPNHLLYALLFFLPAPFQSGGNVLGYGHRRKQCIILKQITDPTLLRLHIDPCRRRK